MDLSAEQFGLLLSSLQVENSEEPGAEKRRAPRVARRVHVTITSAEGTTAESIRVLATNLSSRGMCLLRGDPMRTGEQFVLHLTRDKQSPTRILCTAVHSRLLPSGQYSIGAEFVCVLNERAYRNHETQAREAQRIRQSVLR